MTPRHFDVIIVGLGAAGSAALFHVARSGATVMGIDRFVPPHDQGSTHSESRIIRKAYFEGVKYLPILTRAYTLWHNLEEMSGLQLMHLGGSLNIGHADSEMIRSACESAAASGTKHRLLSSEEVNDRYPAYHLQSGQVALLDIEAGYIHPERCVRAHLQQASAYGAYCRFGKPVTSCAAEGDRVTVKAGPDTFQASRVILTAGAWMRDFAPVPLAIERVTTSWFSTVAQKFAPDACPVFILEENNGLRSYGFPDLGNGVKIGLHHAGPLAEHPDDVSRTLLAEDEAGVRSVLERIMPDAAGTCRNTTVCMYSNTPDKDYLIDYLGGTDPRFVVGSACSGHGFKASSAVGEALAALALGNTPPVDLSPFKWRWT